MELSNNNITKISTVQLQELSSLLNEEFNGKDLPCGHRVKKVKNQSLDYLINSCSICLESFQSKSISKYYCSHIFDEDCTKRYIKETFKCAICREITNHIQNYKTPTEYLNYECIECNNEPCCENKLQTQANKISVNIYYRQIYPELIENNLNIAGDSDLMSLMNVLYGFFMINILHKIVNNEPNAITTVRLTTIITLERFISTIVLIFDNLYSIILRIAV